MRFTILVPSNFQNSGIQNMSNTQVLKNAILSNGWRSLAEDRNAVPVSLVLPPPSDDLSYAGWKGKKQKKLNLVRRSFTRRPS